MWSGWCCHRQSPQTPRPAAAVGHPPTTEFLRHEHCLSALRQTIRPQIFQDKTSALLPSRLTIEIGLQQLRRKAWGQVVNITEKLEQLEK